MKPLIYAKPSKRGSVKAIAGNSVTKMIIVRCTMRYGANSLTMTSIPSPVKLDVTNRISPMGGVANPTVTLMHMMMAKCSGSTPNWNSVGPRIGPMMRMAGTASKNMPG